MISFSAYLLDHEDSSGRLELTEFPPEYTDLVVVSGHELYVHPVQRGSMLMRQRVSERERIRQGDPPVIP
jgi:hypothetical protein